MFLMQVLSFIYCLVGWELNHRESGLCMAMGWGFLGFQWSRGCVVRSSCAVPCAWQIRCKGKVGPIQQSFLRNPTGQVPGLPTEPGVSLGLVGGNVFFIPGNRRSFKERLKFLPRFPKMIGHYRLESILHTFTSAFCFCVVYTFYFSILMLLFNVQ